MGGINTGRWIVGGLIAGVIIAVVDVILNGMMFNQAWIDANAALNLPPMTAGAVVTFIAIDFVIGLTAVWIYVAARPRFGANARTAIHAGLLAWLLTILLPNAFLLVSGYLPSGIVWADILVGLVSITVGTVAGAYFYQEDNG
jgi:hypothetical protein